MEDVLRAFREATGTVYDGDYYGLDDLIPEDDVGGVESDIEVPIEDEIFENSDSEEENISDKTYSVCQKQSCNRFYRIQVNLS